MEWGDVRYFLALSRLGSVRAAGVALKVSHSTVLRRVQALEEQLGARLFDRTRDGWSLTEAGERLVPRAQRVEEELLAVERDLAGQDERLVGPVSITCSDAYVGRILIDELAPFFLANSGIELHLSMDGRQFDLARREADLAVRLVGLESSLPEELLGTRIGELHLASYVARTHRESLDPESPQSAPRWLSYGNDPESAKLRAESSYPGLPVWGQFAAVPLMVVAARRGLGIAMLPTHIGDVDPALQRLTRPDLRHVGYIWLLSHPDLRTNARLRAVRAAAAEALRRHAPLFRGERPIDAPDGCEIAPGALGSSCLVEVQDWSNRDR